MKKIAALMLALSIWAAPVQADPLEDFTGLVGGLFGALLEMPSQEEAPPQLEIFDYDKMARRTVGRHWRRFTPRQKRIFTHLIEKRVKRLILDRVAPSLNSSMILEWDRMEIYGYRAEVNLKLKCEGKCYHITYRLIDHHGEWKAYDILIEGRSMLSQYRHEFTRFLNRYRPQDLINDLQSRR